MSPQSAGEQPKGTGSAPWLWLSLRCAGSWNEPAHGRTFLTRARSAISARSSPCSMPHGVTQGQIAELTGITQGRLSEWATGKRKPQRDVDLRVVRRRPRRCRRLRVEALGLACRSTRRLRAGPARIPGRHRTSMSAWSTRARRRRRRGTSPRCGRLTWPTSRCSSAGWSPRRRGTRRRFAGWSPRPSAPAAAMTCQAGSGSGWATWSGSGTRWRCSGELDDRFGGGHARDALIQYLQADAVRLLRGRYPDDVGSALLSAVAEATQLAAWMTYDSTPAQPAGPAVLHPGARPGPGRRRPAARRGDPGRDEPPGHLHRPVPRSRQTWPRPPGPGPPGSRPRP